MNRKKHLRQPIGTTDCLLRVIRLSWFDSRHHRRHLLATTRLATSPHSVETAHSCGQTHRPDEILPPAPPVDWKPSRTLASDHPGHWTLPRKKRSDAIAARGFTEIRLPHRRNLSYPSTLSLESHSKYHAIYANSGNS